MTTPLHHSTEALGREERIALADLLRFACLTAADGVILLDCRKRRLKAVRRAEREFENAAHLIFGEALSDWPSLCRRLRTLAGALGELDRVRIGLDTLGVRRDSAHLTPRSNAARRSTCRKVVARKRSR